jgi:hypothetical protein
MGDQDTRRSSIGDMAPSNIAQRWKLASSVTTAEITLRVAFDAF